MLLHRAKPFPTFLEAREDLVLKELTMENRKEAPAAALAASTTTTWPLRPLVWAPGALVEAPRLPTTVAASAAVAAKATAIAALQDRALDLLVARRSSSRLPEGALGPASTILGLAPSRCGQRALVHLWCPSRCPLASRRSSKRSSSRRLLPTSGLLPLVLHHGSLQGFTTL